MLKKNTFYLLSILLLLAACSGPSRQELINTISENEQNLFSEDNMEPKEQQCETLYDNYINFAERFPEDPDAPKYLFLAADLSNFLQRYNETIALYDEIFNDYPDFDKRPDCLFLKAYTYENHIKDLKAARVCYNTFLDVYPDHAFAQSAVMSLKFLGMNPEEVMKQLIENGEENQ